MALADPPPLSCTHYTHTSSIHSSRNPSWTEIPLLGTNANEVERVIHHAERSAGLTSRHYQKIDALANLENTEHLGMLQEKTPDTRDSIIPFPQISLDHLNGPHPAYSENPTSGNKKPFQKWMRSLHRRATHRPAIRDTNENNLSWKHLTPDGTDRTDRTGLHRRFRNRDSTSGSSFRFVSAVQSASISLASASAVTQSRRNATLSYWPSETDHSSQASMCEPVLSEDSVAMGRPMPVDAAVTRRSLQRRQILEELISTEESYIGDVRFLMNVYVTILVSLPTLPMRLRSSINQNLTEIVELHEEILGDLHRIVPHSDRY